MDDSSQYRYRFGPRDRRGLIAGFSSSQVVIGAGSVAGAVASFRLISGQSRFVVALVVVVLGVVATIVPLAGQTVVEWTPPAAKHLVALVGGSRRSIATAHGRAARASVPTMFSDFRVVGVQSGDGPRIGAVFDRASGHLTAVLSMSGESYPLLSESERARRVAAWSAVLAASATHVGPVVQLKWIERTVPDAAEALRARVADLLASAEDSAAAGARTSYAQFVQVETSSGLRHELLLAITVRSRPSSRRSSDRTATGDRTPGASLAREVAQLEQRCRDSGIAIEGVLSEQGIRKVLRSSFDQGGVVGGVSWPWPVATEATWAAVRTDGIWHATYWIAEWPRNDVDMGFLLPLLLGSVDRRAVSVAMIPVAPRKAVRAAEHARTSTISDAELRRRHGFALTARMRSEHEAVARREVELSLGHAAYRFSGYVTVSAANRLELESSCARVEQASAQAHLEIRRLYGMQAAAFGFTMCCGRGCT